MFYDLMPDGLSGNLFFNGDFLGTFVRPPIDIFGSIELFKVCLLSLIKGTFGERRSFFKAICLAVWGWLVE